jgi:hypothetical protein
LRPAPLTLTFQGTYASIDAGHGSLILHQYWLNSTAAEQEDFGAFAFCRIYKIKPRASPEQHKIL